MILVDMDVILDVALDRPPWGNESATLLRRLEVGPNRAFVAWHTLSNLYYLLQSKREGATVREFLGELTGFLRVAPTDAESFRFALGLPMTDLEDAMQVAAAQACGAEWIATRNLTDFQRSPIPARSPADLLEILG